MSESPRQIMITMQENVFTIEDMNAVVEALKTVSIENTFFQVNGLIKFEAASPTTPTPTPTPEP
jgi:hypothetical protein